MFDIKTLEQIAIWCSIVGLPIGSLGLAITLYYAYRAKTAADAASVSAEAARQAVGRVNSLVDLEECRRLLSDLLKRMDAPNWEIVSERCMRIRELLISVQGDEASGLSTETRASLAGLLVQIRNINNISHGTRDENRKVPDLIRISRILSDQAEVLARAAGEMKIRIGGASNE